MRPRHIRTHVKKLRSAAYDILESTPQRIVLLESAGRDRLYRAATVRADPDVPAVSTLLPH